MFLQEIKPKYLLAITVISKMYCNILTKAGQTNITHCTLSYFLNF